MGSDGNKKISIIVVSAILVVAAVGGVAYVVGRRNGESNDDGAMSTTAKAIKAVCQPTDYKETCEESLASAKTTDPKELMKIAFKASVDNINDVVRKFPPLKEAAKDPGASEAVEICEQVLYGAVDDMQSAVDRIGALNLDNLDVDVGDLRTWTGGASTYHETCLDAFENTTGETGEKMKELVKTAGELTSNGLAMVVSITKFLNTLELPGNKRRRLLQENNVFDDDDEDGFPSFVDSTKRKLLQAAPPKPNVVVAKDGSGQFKTIREALNTVPMKNKVPYVILIKAGVYNEYLLITKQMKNVVLVGEGPTKTKITGNRNFIDGTKTYLSGTVIAEGRGFVARDIGIENTAGPEKHQAVALRVSGDESVIYNCQIDAYQDTLYAHNHRQFYRDCTISGTVDFVFGDAQATFQNCKFVVRKPNANQACMVTAQGRKDHNGPGALILQNSQILAAPDLGATKVYLGRPWKLYSRTLIMNSFIGGFIAPEGWSPWQGDFALDTCYYGEYQNKGPGADTSKRVTWKGIQKITPQIAGSFAPSKYYQAGDAFILATAVPYDANLM